MVCKTISGISVKAITSALPSERIGADEFSVLYGRKEVARVARGTGINSIRTANGMTTSDMIAAAVNHLIRGTDINKADIDALIVVTQTPDDWSPGTAFAVHHQLELNTSCFVATVNDGCAGYANGLVLAASLVASGTYKNVLLCTGDINTRLVDDDDYKVRMLFGDAASATLITSGDDTLSFISGADGSGKDLLGVKLDYQKQNNKIGSIGSLQMDGAAVMSFVLRRVPDVINSLLQEKELKKDNIDLFVLHQPNEFILNYIRNILDLDSDKLPTDVDGIGNTNSTSIPLLLSRRNWLHDAARENVIVCGFGVGLSWNALHIDLSGTKIIKPFEID